MKKMILLTAGLFLSLMLKAQEQNEWDAQLNQAAALIKSNPEAAEAAFDNLLKGKNKKNADLLVDIGQAYLKEGNYQVAGQYAERAKDADGKCADAYVLSGDVALAQKNVNQASGDYSQAIYLDDDCSEAYLKYAEVYQGVNPQLSIDMLMRLQEKCPDDARIQKQLGDIYYSMGDYTKAIDAYDDYLENGTPGVQDYSRYAMLLYLNKEYDQSLQVAEKGLAMDADNLVLKRLKMYDNYELGAHDAGLENAADFFARPDTAGLVYLDYVYYGRLLKEKQRYDDALTQYGNALALDDLQADVYREMSDVYEDKRDFPNAITCFQKYLDVLKTPSDVGDMFLYGRLNYFAATDSTHADKQAAYLAEADTAFAQVMDYAPDNYLGSFWRARTNSLLDPETTQGLAKPYYETSLAILEKNPNSAKDLQVECLSYLGYYYFVKEDYPQSKVYWTRILEIDPTNETAKQALEGIH